MTTVTLDRFGRVVIPHALRQRHGWRPGTTLEIEDGPDGLSLHAADAPPALPPGWIMQDGLPVFAGQVVGDADVPALLERLHAERDREILGQ